MPAPQSPQLIPGCVPNSGLSRLIDGYRRFRKTGWTPHRDRWAVLQESHSPETMVIACSDSRVDPAQIFDVDPGEIFVVRNVAAMVPPFEVTPGLHGVSAALEFAVQVLKVRNIMVLGHGMCGGAKAALTHELRGAPHGEGGFIASWIALLDGVREPLVACYGTKGHEAERAMEQAGVRVSLKNLRSFPWIHKGEEAGTLQLIGAFFAISDGVLHLLDEDADIFVPAIGHPPVM